VYLYIFITCLNLPLKICVEVQGLLEHMRDIKNGIALTYRFSIQFLKTELQSNEFKMMDVLVQRSTKATVNNIE
jgi:hypothetical protein